MTMQLDILTMDTQPRRAVMIAGAPGEGLDIAPVQDAPYDPVVMRVLTAFVLACVLTILLCWTYLILLCVHIANYGFFR